MARKEEIALIAPGNPLRELLKQLSTIASRGSPWYAVEYLGILLVVQLCLVQGYPRGLELGVVSLKSNFGFMQASRPSSLVVHDRGAFATILRTIATVLLRVT